MSKTPETDEREAAFKEAYTSLNAAQQQAVDTIEGPVMVIAGPGTGKTQILTLRIANILRQTDVQPENILALTFTEAGATAMRERLRGYIGSRAYRVPIHTFHGFCGELIARYPDAYPTIIGGRPATDLERLRLIEELLQDPAIKSLRPAGRPTYYVKPVSSALSTLKREYISPEKLAAYNTTLKEQLANTEQYHEKGAHKGKVRGEYSELEKRIRKNDELHWLYERYNAMLREVARYDFEDMIIETVAALKRDEGMLRDLQETYQYLHADEHQDVNQSQNEIISLLSSYHEHPNVFVVGDEKQAIYRFQGASLENFLYFENAFAGATTISLTENYRSSQAILDAAHELIAEPENELLKDLRVPLTADTAKPGSVELRAFSHQAIEDDWVSQAVAEQLAAGVPPSEIAIILRTNREVEATAERLRGAGIEATASAESDVLTHPIAKAVRALIRSVVRPENEEALFTVLHGPYWGISPADLSRVLSSRSYTERLSDLVTSPEKLAVLSLADQAAVSRVGAVLKRARELMLTEPPHRVVAFLIEESGLKRAAMGEDTLATGRVLRRLLDEIELMVSEDQERTLYDIDTNLHALIEHGLGLTAPFIVSGETAVQVMTAHKAKGLEFAVVIVPHLTDSGWGGNKRSEYFSLPLTQHLDADLFSALDDERRLLYVSMTRAKRTLLLSYAETNTDGRSFTKSRLLEYIPETLLTEPSTEALEAAFDPLAAVAGPERPEALSPELLRQLFAERGFSATSLNNFLESPYTYLYRNIYRIPEVQNQTLLYGTAVHDVLETITRRHTKEGKWASVSEVSDLLHRALAQLPLGPGEYAALHERGLAALTVYLEHLKATVPAVTREELNLSVVLPSGLDAVPEIPLRGKLDRLDLGEDGVAFRVVDYKTGKPKTRNVIEGKTKSSDGGYKRQLVFYALLLSLYEDERYQTRTGVLSFVEPDKHGVVKEEAFEVTPEEIEELRETIIGAAESFISGAFLKEPCDPAVSDYCDLFAELAQQEK